MRGLFTQTIALRLRSAEETRMVLGDGTAVLAPAHRVTPAAPGCGWVVEDDGTADRVRADHWPDPLVRAVAARYPAPILRGPRARQGASASTARSAGRRWAAGGDGPQEHARALAAAADEARRRPVGRPGRATHAQHATPHAAARPPAAAPGSPSAGFGWARAA